MLFSSMNNKPDDLFTLLRIIEMHPKAGNVNNCPPKRSSRSILIV